MKKILLALTIVFLLSCRNGAAENKPTDLDHTKNNDTSVIKKDSLNPKIKDSLDSAHQSAGK